MRLGEAHGAAAAQRLVGQPAERPQRRDQRQQPPPRVSEQEGKGERCAEGDERDCG
ncbi:MAG: hypothetical protein M5R40_13890 [Anaerolineae bacterium]|nr:hypothetical protein [Anaerolineae bacterium]